jgi:hypothetical protein
MILSRTAMIRGRFYEKFRKRNLTFSHPGAIIRSSSRMGEEWELRGIGIHSLSIHSINKEGNEGWRSKR